MPQLWWGLRGNVVGQQYNYMCIVGFRADRKEPKIHVKRSETKFTLGLIPQLQNQHWLWLYQWNSSPSDCHLFTALKQNLGGHKFKDDREVQTVVTRWLITQDTDWYRQWVEKLVTRYDKWLSCGEDYVEMQWGCRTIKRKLFLLEAKITNPEHTQCKVISWLNLT
jgi:hypothetical protein